VNVGGTGKLPMAELVRMSEAVGFENVTTYIATGNVAFKSGRSEDEVRYALQERLKEYAGKDLGVVVRTATELADTLARNPFSDSPGNRVTALFVDEILPADPLDGVTGITNEEVKLGKRELFVLYPDGLAKTRLRIPSDRRGTARNMNTVAKLAEIAAAVN